MELAHLPDDKPEGNLFPIKNLLDFPKKNEELIGLSYEQFIKSIVLAQGAFDQFSEVAGVGAEQDAGEAHWHRNIPAVEPPGV